MEDEDDLLPISALQHLVFCPRQCALIHIERAWAENRLTAEGGLLHARVRSVLAVGLLWHEQARLMAAHLRGDLDGYPPFVSR